MSDKAKITTCSYWQRQEIRMVDLSIGPMPPMKDDDVYKLAEAEEREDKADPPCGTCEACTISQAEAMPFIEEEMKAPAKKTKKKAKPERVHREWFRLITSRTCACGQKRTDVYSWGEYVRGSWRTVDTCCEHCFTDRVLPRLLNHAAQCGCSFELTAYRGATLPAWLRLPESTAGQHA